MTGSLSLRELSLLPITKLSGIGDRKAAALEKAEITNVLELLTHYPRRYIDRTKEATIAELGIGEEGMVLARVDRVSSRRARNRRTIVNVTVSDRTGTLSLTFFNQPWRERQLHEGMNAIVYGKVDTYRGARQMTNPIIDLVGDRTGRIVPVYPQSEGVTTWDLAAWVQSALARCEPRGILDPVPEAILARHELIDRTAALRQVHHPDNMGQASQARRRLVFDELLRIQVELVVRKRELEASTRSVVHDTSGSLVQRFHDQLGFDLTGAQRRAIDDIVADLGKDFPMHRLLQGDVGSGKTVVAISALLVAVQGGHQGALMAPTEVLAEQHAMGVSEILSNFVVGDDNLFGERPLRVEILTNTVAAARRREVLAGLADGTVDLLIGTHALIQDAVEFSSLGAVVIDEQHRFGVEQRAALRAKNAHGAVPDVLVMTATPIPRTAAMTVYGDLDVSVLDELPPGRTPIETRWADSDDAEQAVWQQVRDEVADGRQAYVVCPLIQESDKLEVRSAEETFAELTTTLDGLRLGLLHGRLSSSEKEQVMDLFRSGALDVMVATTVIEVGVDVPNATVMVILDADRFGIAQLHQLRGRVGRGAHLSYCHLVASEVSDDGTERLEAMVRTTDGFELAEVDLDLRGEGTIMGERQKGRNDLKLASLRRDREWVEIARDEAIALVDSSDQETLDALLDEVAVVVGEANSEFLLKN
jgi:ATP-dependent DNA helicase RecG